ncbi:hypothetical protein AgCh_030526 [Apium graveolens]
MAISKLFFLSIILVAFTFSANISPASASSRRLLNFFPPGFPFGGSFPPAGDGSAPPSGFHFPAFPPFPFFSSPVGNGTPGGMSGGIPGGMPGDFTPPQTTTTTATPAP